MTASDLARCRPILDAFRAGELSAPIALMELLIATEDARAIEHLLAAEPSTSLQTLAALLADNREGCERIAAILRAEQPQHAQAASIEQGLATARALFDGLVAHSEEASVALYSLGNPAILAQATQEIVALLEGWSALGPSARVLDIGCGIGRLEVALAPRVRAITGIDVSEAMVRTARRRTQHLENVAIELANGRDLRLIADRSQELVLAVDSFPYVVQAGLALADQLFGEIARVLAEGGVFALLNFSYRGDAEQDAQDVVQLAARHRLSVEVHADRPFSLWNGTVFRLRR